MLRRPAPLQAPVRSPRKCAIAGTAIPGGRQGVRGNHKGIDNMLNKYLAAGVAAAALLGAAGTAQAGKDLDAIKARGQLICGVSTGVAGFAVADGQGKWTGLDVDTCRAVAAALFGDSEKVKYVPTTAQQRFTALQSGEVDMLARTTTWTLTRDTALGFDFTGINYYDGQAFILNNKLRVH